MSNIAAHDTASHKDAIRMSAFIGSTAAPSADTATGRTRRPLIGITAGTRTLTDGAWAGYEATAVTTNYTTAIREAGGRPVILTPGEVWSADELADLDGIVITGGTDIDPARYGAGALPTDFAADEARDAFEIELAQAAEENGIPVLGICRGLQIINVARGGTLIQHLADEDLAYPRSDQQLTEVPIEVDADSDVALALGTAPTVSAFHHQAIDALGRGLRVVARHASGVVHAVQSSSGAPVLAVQFHPETRADAAELFARFVGITSGSRAVAPSPKMVTVQP